jgi:hypothetical protein
MFWHQAYPETFGAPFEPVDELVSYDSLDPSSPEVCDIETYDMPNAIKFGFMPSALPSPRRHHKDNVQIESGQALLFKVCRPDDTASYALKRLKNSDRVRDSNARSTPCEQ